jgi:hypothetical protein
VEVVADGIGVLCAEALPFQLTVDLGAGAPGTAISCVAFMQKKDRLRHEMRRSVAISRSDCNQAVSPSPRGRALSRALAHASDISSRYRSRNRSQLMVAGFSATTDRAAPRRPARRPSADHPGRYRNVVPRQSSVMDSGRDAARTLPERVVRGTNPFRARVTTSVRQTGPTALPLELVDVGVLAKNVNSRVFAGPAAFPRPRGGVARAWRIARQIDSYALSASTARGLAISGQRRRGRAAAVADPFCRTISPDHAAHPRADRAWCSSAPILPKWLTIPGCVA